MKLSQITFHDPEYTITNYINIPNTVLQYKKHFTHLEEAKDLPASIYCYYFPDNQPISNIYW